MGKGGGKRRWNEETRIRWKELKKKKDFSIERLVKKDIRRNRNVGSKTKKRKGKPTEKGKKSQVVA